MSDAAQIFNEAYELIEQGDLASARQLLDDVRAENQNNPDFWWLYAHAAEDATTGRDALNRVRQLRSDYPGLNTLLEKTSTDAPRPIQSLRPPSSLPDLPSQDIEGDFDDDFDMVESAGDGNRRTVYIVAGVLVIAAIILGVVFIPSLLNDGADATPTATTILVQPTTEVPLATTASIDITEDVIESATEAIPTQEDIEPTEELTPTPEDVEPTNEVVSTEEDIEPTDDEVPTVDITEEVATRPDDGDYTELASQLSQFDVPEEGIEVGETTLGETLLITTCSPPGPVSTQSILGIAEALKDEAIGDDIEAIGFRIANCSDDSTVRIIGVSRSQFDDFVNDNISAQQLQSSMRPIG